MNSSQRRARNLLPKMVFHDLPVYQEEHAAQLIMARRLHSPLKGRIHLRRSVDPLFVFPLQSDGGPYICGTKQIPMRRASRDLRIEKRKACSSSIEFGPTWWQSAL